jgi:hypothetical protein
MPSEPVEEVVVPVPVAEDVPEDDVGEVPELPCWLD